MQVSYLILIIEKNGLICFNSWEIIIVRFNRCHSQNLSLNNLCHIVLENNELP